MSRECRARPLACAFLAVFVAGCTGDKGYDSRSAKEWAARLDTAADPQHRIEAANAFLRSPPHTYENVHALLTAAAMDEEGIVRTMARAALAHLKEDATPALVRALSDANDSIRVRAMSALGSIGIYAYGARDTVKALAAKPGPLRAAALEALPNVDTETHSFVTLYREAMTDTSERVRLAAVRNFWAGARTLEHDVVSALVAGLTDPSDSVRIASVEVLTRMGPPAKGALPALAQLQRELPTGDIADLVRAAIVAIRGSKPPI